MNVTITLTSKQFELLRIAGRHWARETCWPELLDAVKALENEMQSTAAHLFGKQEKAS